MRGNSGKEDGAWVYWIADDERCARLIRALDFRVVQQDAKATYGSLEELLRASGDSRENRFRGVHILNEIHEQMEPAGKVPLVDALDDSVRIERRREVRRRDDDDLVREAEEMHGGRANSRASIDQKHVVIRGCFDECASEIVENSVLQIRKTTDAGSTADEIRAVCAFGDRLSERNAPVDDIEDRRAGIHARKNVNVGHAQIAIENERPSTEQAERSREVYGHRGFPDAAFSTRHRDHAQAALNPEERCADSLDAPAVLKQAIVDPVNPVGAGAG